MVFFVCDQCGESVKKNAVEKHLSQCRSDSFSCMDCSKNFTSISYKDHIKCISEDQKFGGKKFVAKENRGEVKQNQWIELVQAAIDGVDDPSLRKLLERIKNYANIPRKETKFINFLQNSLRIYDKKLRHRAWEAIIHQTKALTAAAEAESSTKTQNGTTNDVDQKPKLDQEQPVEDIEKKQEVMDFKWKSTIKKTLKAAPKQQMKLKRLKKKVFAIYRQSSSADGDDAEMLFDSKMVKLVGDQLEIIDEGKIVRLL